MNPRVLVSGIEDPAAARQAATLGAEFLAGWIRADGAAWGAGDAAEDLHERCELVGVLRAEAPTVLAADWALDHDVDFLLAAPGVGEFDRSRMPVRWIADLDHVPRSSERSRSLGAAWAWRLPLPADRESWTEVAELARAHRLIFRVSPGEVDWHEALELAHPFAIDLAWSEATRRWLAAREA